MREALDIIELLFSTTDYVDFTGKFWELDHKRIQVRPYQEHPQFSIAGMSGTHNFELCGERGYAALSIYFTPVQIADNPGMPDLIAQGNAIVKAAEAAGRDPLDEKVGGFGSLLFNSREWVTIDRWHRSLELFARYVSPHFRARDDQRFRRELADDALGG